MIRPPSPNWPPSKSAGFRLSEARCCLRSCGSPHHLSHSSPMISPFVFSPSPYYTFSAGPAQFFALDTNEVSEAQLLWLDAELKKSSAKWKLVYGHHPIYSDGRHGDSQVLIEKLLPL